MYDHTVNDVYAAMLTQTTGAINIRFRTEETWIQKLRTRTSLRLNQIQWWNAAVKALVSYSPRYLHCADTSWVFAPNKLRNISVGIATIPTPGKKMFLNTQSKTMMATRRSSLSFLQQIPGTSQNYPCLEQKVQNSMFEPLNITKTCLYNFDPLSLTFIQ